LILAAGQSTRMRSQTPKLLHDLCGAPMIAWPVRAARQAGAGRVVVVDSPGRPLEVRTTPRLAPTPVRRPKPPARPKAVGP